MFLELMRSTELYKCNKLETTRTKQMQQTQEKNRTMQFMQQTPDNHFGMPRPLFSQLSV